MKNKTTCHSKKPLTDEVRAAVIEYFLSHTNNTMPALAKEFNISEYTASRVIDGYYKNNLQNVLRSENNVLHLSGRYNKTKNIMAVKITQKDFNLGKEFRFENEDNELDVWFEDGIGPNWINKFRMRFNGELSTFKTLITLNRNVNLLVDKYELKNTEDEDVEE